MAGGTPIEFGVIGICDGIAMGHEGLAQFQQKTSRMAATVKQVI